MIVNIPIPTKEFSAPVDYADWLRYVSEPVEEDMELVDIISRFDLVIEQKPVPY